MDILQSGAGPRVGCEARISVDPPSLATNTGAYANITWPATAPNVADIQPGKKVVASPTADYNAGYTQGDARVSAAGTIRMQFINTTAGTLDPTSQNIDFMVLG